jgi:hypothetical protein
VRRAAPHPPAGRLDRHELERDLLERIVRLAGDAVPASAGAVVCVLRDGAGAAVVGTDTLAAQVQMLQLATGAGPSLLALSDRRPVVVDPVTADHPEIWAGFAAEGGVTGVVSVPLGARPDLAATLTLYRRAGRRWPRSALEQAATASAVLGELLTSSWPDDYREVAQVP